MRLHRQERARGGEGEGGITDRGWKERERERELVSTLTRFREISCAPSLAKISKNVEQKFVSQAKR